MKYLRVLRENQRSSSNHLATCTTDIQARMLYVAGTQAIANGVSVTAHHRQGIAFVVARFGLRCCNRRTLDHSAALTQFAIRNGAETRQRAWLLLIDRRAYRP